MINEEIARKTLSLEVKAVKVTGKLLLNLLKKLIKEAEKLGGLEKLVKVNGNEVKLKDMAKKGQLEEIPVEEAELKELKKELNKYGVKFSVMKDKETGKYSVFFQAKDMKMMEKAFKNALARSERKTERKESVRKNIEKFKNMKSFDFVLDLLEKTELAIVPGITFQVEGYVRFSIVHDIPVLEEAIKRLEKYIKEK